MHHLPGPAVPKAGVKSAQSRTEYRPCQQRLAHAAGDCIRSVSSSTGFSVFPGQHPRWRLLEPRLTYDGSSPVSTCTCRSSRESTERESSAPGDGARDPRTPLDVAETLEAPHTSRVCTPRLGPVASTHVGSRPMSIYCSQQARHGCLVIPSTMEPTTAPDQGTPVKSGIVRGED